MTMLNFMTEASFYQDLGRGALCAPPRDLIRQKNPGHLWLTIFQHFFLAIPFEKTKLSLLKLTTKTLKKMLSNFSLSPY